MATRLCWSLLLGILLFSASHAVDAQTPPGAAYVPPGAAGGSPPAGSSSNPAAAAGQACLQDIGKYCAAVQPGGGRIAQCLMAHGRQLSPGCVSALKAAGAARQSGQTQTPQ